MSDFKLDWNELDLILDCIAFTEMDLETVGGWEHVGTYLDRLDTLREKILKRKDSIRG